MRHTALAVALVLASALFAPKAHALSPPWYIYANTVEAALEHDPCVQVAELAGSGPNYTLEVDVCTLDKARALATLLRSSIDIAGSTVTVTVHGPGHVLALPFPMPPTLEGVKALIDLALRGNCLYIGVISAGNQGPLFIEFARNVVQFWADNISDAYGNITKVAAVAFDEIMVPGFGPTTSPHYVWGCAGGKDK